MPPLSVSDRSPSEYASRPARNRRHGGFGWNRTFRGLRVGRVRLGGAWDKVYYRPALRICLIYAGAYCVGSIVGGASLMIGGGFHFPVSASPVGA